MKSRIALIEPLVPAGKSLGILKAPESIMALAGELERLDYEVLLFHSPAGDELQAKLEAFNPSLVGISTMTPNFPEGRKVAARLKQWNPSLPIVIGGWHASGCVLSYLAGHEQETLTEILNPNSSFDYVVTGEGEEVLPALIGCLERRERVDLDGVSQFRNGGIDARPRAERIKDLGTLAPPSRSGLKMDIYRDQRTGDLDFSVHFNRGCRFNCGFCLTPGMSGKGVVSTPPPVALAYMKELLEACRPQVITFTDEDFFSNHQWVEEMVPLLAQEDLAGRYGVSFDTFATINDLYLFEKNGQGEFLKRMRATGFGSFTIGIESFNASVLLRYNKEMMAKGTMNLAERTRYERLKRLNEFESQKFLVEHYHRSAQQAINFAMGHGIMVVGDYMLGNLGEKEAEVREGFRVFSDLNNLLIAYLPVFTPFPGTGVWAEAYTSGLLPRTAEGGLDWARFDASAGAMDVGYDIDALRNELEVEFYTSARYRRDMLKALKQNPALKNLFVGRFNYLDRLFPGEERIQSMLALLG